MSEKNFFYEPINNIGRTQFFIHQQIEMMKSFEIFYGGVDLFRKILKSNSPKKEKYWKVNFKKNFICATWIFVTWSILSDSHYKELFMNFGCRAGQITFGFMIQLCNGEFFISFFFPDGEIMSVTFFIWWYIIFV